MSESELLEEQYRQLAVGKPWYEGTGNDDAIMPHQWIGACFGAVARRWILGDEPGTGKTRTVVGWLDLIRAKRVLIICEANIVSQFAGEVEELAPHRPLLSLSRRTPEARHEILDSLLGLDEFVVMTNFESFRGENGKDVLAKLMDAELDTIIVDEAHNLKGTNTVNYKSIEMLVLCDNICGSCGKHIKGLWQAKDGDKKKKEPKPCPSCGWKVDQRKRIEHHNPLADMLVTKSVKNVCFTTGTPLLNSPTDIYPMLHLCDPVLFKTRSGFEQGFLKKNYTGKWEWRGNALGFLKPLIEGRFLARTTADAGIILPTQYRRVIHIDLDKQAYPLQYKVIRQISDFAAIELESGASMTIMHVIALITRKRQANVWPGGIQIIDRNPISPTFGEVLFSVAEEVQESIKMDVLVDNAMSIHEQGRRQLVFSQFTTALDELSERFQERGLRVAPFTGKTPKVLRERIRTNFNLSMGEPPEWDIVLANYKVGGTGLNLTAATATHILDEEWNPGKRDQGYRRTNRIGQTEETEVFIYRISRTIDTWMSNLIQSKEKMIGEFNGAVIDRPNFTPEALLTAIRSGEML